MANQTAMKSSSGNSSSPSPTAVATVIETAIAAVVETTEATSEDTDDAYAWDPTTREVGEVANNFMWDSLRQVMITFIVVVSAAGLYHKCRKRHGVSATNYTAVCTHETEMTSKNGRAIDEDSAPGFEGLDDDELEA